MRAGVVEEGHLAEVTQARVDPEGTVEEVLGQMRGLIDRLMTDREVAGIGVGVPSVVDIEEGIVYDVQNIPSWKEVPLKARLEEVYHAPVFVNNDANCFALGEKHFGKGRGYDSLVGVVVGTGFAGGVIIDGKLYAGPNCGAGEFGMIPYKESVFEHYCAGLFFEREHGTTGARLYRQASEGDAEALKIFRTFGRHLGQAIKAVLYAYDPELIVMGGSVRKAYRFFQETMWKTIRTFAYARTLERLKFELSEEEHIAILGAAALVLDAEIGTAV